MSKKIIIILVLAVILLVAFLVMNNKQNQNPDIVVDKGGNVNENIEVIPTEVVGEGSLLELLKRNENLECSIVYEQSQGGAVEGSYFTSNGKVRGDFLTKEGKQEVLSSMIIKDGTFYSWSLINGEKFGMKADFSNLENATTSDNQEKPRADKGPISMDEKVQYSCKPWNNVDGSIFEPPTDVLFRDYESIIKTGMEYGNIYEME